MGLWKDTTAVSEIIGIVLLLALSIGLFSFLYMSTMSNIDESNAPSANIIGYVDGNNIILEHHGGESITSSSYIGLMVADEKTLINISGSYLKDENSNNRWDIGEKIVYSSDIEGVEVKASVIDEASNSLIYDEVLQHGSGGSPGQISTMINEIIPYEIADVSFDITADSTGTNPDNVSLYYRWSKTSGSAESTMLYYDDFEAGFGNYTPGGWDCGLYTGGTYAHQGSNAMQIQDSGFFASFFLTDDVDVHTPNYSSILVDFWFTKVANPGARRQFFIDFYDGSDLVNIATYSLDDYANGEFYHEQVWINESEYVFPTDMYISFEGGMPNNNDDVFFDQIYINATTSSRVTVFETSFEEADDLTDWVVDSARTTAGSGYTLERENDGWYGPKTGSHYLAGTGNFDPEYAAYNQTIDISLYENVSVSVWYSVEDTESEDEVGFYYWDGSDWSVIFEDLSPSSWGQTSWEYAQVDIDDSIDQLILQFLWSTSALSEHVMIDDLEVTGDLKNPTEWMMWDDSSNPDDSSPWQWTFDFPFGRGEYEFYSIGRKSGLSAETAPANADAECFHNP